MLNVFKYHKEAVLPNRNLPSDAGLDLYALNNVFVEHGTTAIIDTGVAIDIPVGYFGKIFDRSSLGSKGLAVGGGVIDSGFSGAIKVVLHNLTNKQDDHYFPGIRGYQICAGDKIAQIVVQPCLLTDCVETVNLWHSQRGDKALGSSGR